MGINSIYYKIPFVYFCAVCYWPCGFFSVVVIRFCCLSLAGSGFVFVKFKFGESVCLLLGNDFLLSANFKVRLMLKKTPLPVMNVYSTKHCVHQLNSDDEPENASLVCLSSDVFLVHWVWQSNGSSLALATTIPRNRCCAAEDRTLQDLNEQCSHDARLWLLATVKMLAEIVLLFSG